MLNRQNILLAGVVITTVLVYMMYRNRTLPSASAEK
jgi:hypothetical protein